MIQSGATFWVGNPFNIGEDPNSVRYVGLVKNLRDPPFSEEVPPTVIGSEVAYCRAVTSTSGFSNSRPEWMDLEYINREEKISRYIWKTGAAYAFFDGRVHRVGVRGREFKVLDCESVEELEDINAYSEEEECETCDTSTYDHGDSVLLCLAVCIVGMFSAAAFAALAVAAAVVGWSYHYIINLGW